MRNKDVASFSQFFPGMDWSADHTDQSRQRIQNNFNQLISQGAIRVGPDGNYQIVPQFPMEKLVQGLLNPNKLSGPLPIRQGPQRRKATIEQGKALFRLGKTDNLDFRLGDFFPGNDWDYLKTLFPEVKTERYGTTNDLIDAYRNLNKIYR